MRTLVDADRLIWSLIDAGIDVTAILAAASKEVYPAQRALDLPGLPDGQNWVRIIVYRYNAMPMYERKRFGDKETLPADTANPVQVTLPSGEVVTRYDAYVLHEAMDWYRVFYQIKVVTRNYKLDQAVGRLLDKALPSRGYVASAAEPTRKFFLMQPGGVVVQDVLNGQDPMFSKNYERWLEYPVDDFSEEDVYAIQQVDLSLLEQDTNRLMDQSTITNTP